MPDEFFPPNDFDGYDYPDEFSRGDANPDDFFMMSEDEFNARDFAPPDNDGSLEIPPYNDEWFEYDIVFSSDDELHIDSYDLDTVAVLNLRDVDPAQMRRHVFADVNDAIEWLTRTGLFTIGSLVDLGGGFFGVAIHNTGKSSVA